MELHILGKTDYAGHLTVKKYDIAINFYTKNQMKAIYPNKNYRIVGEINNKTGVQCGTAQNQDGKPLPVYKENTHNKLTERIIGYTAVNGYTYLAVVKAFF